MIGSTTWKNFPSTHFALLIIPIAILAGVSGCGGAKIIQESVIVRDTLVVTQERTLTDTLIMWKDTTIVQNGVKVRVEYLDRFVKVKADCPSDTIRITQTKVVYQEPVFKHQSKKPLEWEFFIGWIVVFLIAWAILQRLLKKYL